MRAEEPSPGPAGMMICVHCWPQPATGNHLSVRANRSDEHRPSTTLGTETPKIATAMEA